MIADFHIHSEFSCDTDERMEKYIHRAKERNIEHICFTEHVDLNVADFGYRYYRPELFFEKFFGMKKQYEDQVKIYAGIEIGEPYLYGEELRALSMYSYDFIIGSVHWIGDMFPSQEIREKYSVKEIYEAYWDEVLKTVKYGGFDALGHLDFPKRYYGEVYYVESKIKEIFKYLLEQDLVIEINTSSLRKGHEAAMPGVELLQLYKECGGKYVTLGSDAHEAEHLGADFDAAKKVINELEFQEVIYEMRTRKAVM